MYPDQAREIDKGYSDGGSIMWKAFTKVSGLDRLFRFTPPTITNGLDNDKASKDQTLDK
jgi:hypothetical protein